MNLRIPALFIAMAWLTLSAQTDLALAVVKYGGGGDWYANPTALPNLARFCNQNLGTTLQVQPQTIELSSPNLFNYPLIHLTGHGNILLTENEVSNLRSYLLAGGFLHADDNYGLKTAFLREMKRVFPELDWVQLSKEHPVFQRPYAFPQGLPKIHEHDGQPPVAMALYTGNRMMALFTYETDLGDGWEDPAVHNDPEEVRQKALKMGANLIYYAFYGGH
jgi:hypothetical protein